MFTCRTQARPFLTPICMRTCSSIMLESSNWRLEGGSEASIADKDSRVAKSIASYKASLDKETSSLKRSERKSRCSEESISSYRKGSFEEALELFAEYTALIESESIVDPEVRATLYSNIAVCLHQLGEWDLAKLYYDAALAIFDAATTSTAAWLYYGDIKQKKVDHINGQKALLGEQKKPANTTYIDANGQRRGFYDTDASWFSYSSWVAWYFGAAAAAAPAGHLPRPRHKHRLSMRLRRRCICLCLCCVAIRVVSTV